MLIGEKIKKERQSRGLSLLDAASDCGISESQLYKIENNKATVRNTTLLKLATFYGYDIVNNQDNLINDDIGLIFRTINKDIKNRDISQMASSLQILDYIIKKSTNSLETSIGRQYHYLINGMLSIDKKDYLSANESILSGIKSFNPFIDTYSFNNIGTSYLQLRLLMAYAITFRRMKEFDKCLYLLQKVLSNIYKNDEMHKKTIYNISNIHSLTKSYDHSFTILDAYFRNKKITGNIDYDNILYFKRATVSYRIGDKSYYNYALRCLYSSALTGDITNGLVFLKVFNNLFDKKIMDNSEFLAL